ncbi:MAG TPA: hypothetical protein VL286_07445 [Rhizomicrobium sp.]|nr:hypothetical protein [Rhizomicrobium sp.]
MAETLDLMPLPERARRYRELSSRALQDALDSSPGRMRDGYVSLALGWASLAENCEKLMEEQAEAAQVKINPHTDNAGAPPDNDDTAPALPEQAAQSGLPDLSIAALKKPPEPEPDS